MQHAHGIIELRRAEFSGQQTRPSFRSRGGSNAICSALPLRSNGEEVATAKAACRGRRLQYRGLLEALWQAAAAMALVLIPGMRYPFYQICAEGQGYVCNVNSVSIKRRDRPRYECSLAGRSLRFSLVVVCRLEARCTPPGSTITYWSISLVSRTQGGDVRNEYLS